MDKMLTVIFEDEKKASEGIKVLAALHNEGSLTLFSTAVIAKDQNGKVTVKQAVTPGPAGTVAGMAVGSLIGIIGGPIGVVAGAATGAIGGSLYDVAQLGVAEDFLADVSQNLSAGKFAIVAEIDEEWVTPLDTRIEAVGGTVLRRARGEFVDTQIEREIAAERAELAKLKAEYQQAVADSKARLKAKIDTAQRRLEARRDQIHEKIQAVKREGEAKVKALQKQADNARGEMKTKLEKRVAEIRAEYKVRSEKLHQAWELIKEAAA